MVQAASAHPVVEIGHALKLPPYATFRNRFSLSALLKTNTLESPIAAAASIGDSRMPVAG